MTPAEAIRALAAGDPVAADRLLPACRAHFCGTEAFGPACIVALCARHPAPLSRLPDIIVTPRSIGLFDADADGREQAWFADLHNGHMSRLWRVGWGGPDPAQPRHSLAFASDPYLSQQRHPVAFRAEDHPDLAPAAVAPLLDAVALAAADPDGGAPCRLAVLRAFSCGDRGAALLVRLGEPLRLAALALRRADAQVVHRRVTWDDERPAGDLLQTLVD